MVLDGRPRGRGEEILRMDGQFYCGDAAETSNILDPRQHSEVHEFGNSVEHLLQTAMPRLCTSRTSPKCSVLSRDSTQLRVGAALDRSGALGRAPAYDAGSHGRCNSLHSMCPNIHSELKVASVVVVMGVGPEEIVAPSRLQSSRGLSGMCSPGCLCIVIGGLDPEFFLDHPFVMDQVDHFLIACLSS